jgi:hypothetical protein
VRHLLRQLHLHLQDPARPLAPMRIPVQGPCPTAQLPQVAPATMPPLARWHVPHTDTLESKLDIASAATISARSHSTARRHAVRMGPVGATMCTTAYTTPPHRR